MADEESTLVEGEDHPLWDWPVRGIHWLIVVLLPASWWTAEEGYLDAHQWLGMTVLIAVLTRVAWGFTGSPQARFCDFLRGPAAAFGYLRGTVASNTPGHNPAGAYSAVLLWSLLVLQALTGLVNSDDVLFTGPFHYVFETDVSDRLAEIHDWLFNVILAAIALHVGAIVYYERVKGQQLLRPMVTGRSTDRSGTGPTQPIFKALVLAALWAAMLWGLMELAPAPPSLYSW